MPSVPASKFSDAPFAMAVAFSAPQLAVFNTDMTCHECEDILVFDLAKSTTEDGYTPRVIPLSSHADIWEGTYGLVKTMAFVEPPGERPWLLVVAKDKAGTVFLLGLDLATESLTHIPTSLPLQASCIESVGSRNGIVALGLVSDDCKHIVHIFTSSSLLSLSLSLLSVLEINASTHRASKHPVLSADGTTLHIFEWNVDLDNATTVTTVPVSATMEAAVEVDIGCTTSYVMATLDPSMVALRLLEDRSVFHIINPLDRGSGHGSCRCHRFDRCRTIFGTMHICGIDMSRFPVNMAILPGFGAVIMLRDTALIRGSLRAQIHVLLESSE